MKGSSVLVLEDDKGVNTLLVDALEADGYDVVSCSRVVEFNVLSRKHKFDLFLIDINLPDGNGQDLALDLRSKTNGGIIMITGRADEIDTVLALELGADDYITKPFRIRELLARVRSVRRRISRQICSAGDPNSANEQTGILVHGLQIVPRSRTVRRSDEKEVKLTDLEFDTLIALASSPNIVLTREDIINRVRGKDWSVSGRSIDGLIGRLRAKLFSRVEGFRRIKTIRGVGYMFQKPS